MIAHHGGSLQNCRSLGVDQHRVLQSAMSNHEEDGDRSREPWSGQKIIFMQAHFRLAAGRCAPVKSMHY